MLTACLVAVILATFTQSLTFRLLHLPTSPTWRELLTVPAHVPASLLPSFIHSLSLPFLYLLLFPPTQTNTLVPAAAISAVPPTVYPVKRFVYVIANITALSGLLFGYDIGKNGRREGGREGRRVGMSEGWKGGRGRN